MTSQNVALWDINIALWAIFLFMVKRIFHLWKRTYLTFNWHNSATSWNFLCGFRQNDLLWQLYQYITIILKYLKLYQLIFKKNQNCLLVTRQNDNNSPGPGPGRLVPSSHQRSELSNTIIGTFSRGDKEVWKCIPIPNDLGGGGGGRSYTCK